MNSSEPMYFRIETEITQTLVSLGTMAGKLQTKHLKFRHIRAHKEGI